MQRATPTRSARPQSLCHPPASDPGTDPKLDVTVQTGLYDAEMFAANLPVNHVIDLIVALVWPHRLHSYHVFLDDVVWVWYYDRQGTIQSSGINFIQDLPRFMVLFIVAGDCGGSSWKRAHRYSAVHGA